MLKVEKSGLLPVSENSTAFEVDTICDDNMSIQDSKEW